MAYRDFILIGAAAMYIIALLLRKQFSLSVMTISIYTVFTTATAYIGSRLLFIFENFGYAKSHHFSVGGFSCFGGVFLLYFMMPLWGKLLKINSKKARDLACIQGLTILAFVRFGCYNTGCCGGKEGILLGRYITWPTQLMESSVDIILVAVLIMLLLSKVNRGRLFDIALIGYGIERFFIEFLRDTPKSVLGMSHGQIFAVISMVLGTVMFIVHKEHSSKEKRYIARKG